MLEGEDVHVARCRHIDVGGSERVFDGGDLIALHRGLECVDRVNFGDDNSCAVVAKGLCGAFANVAVATHDRDLAGNHHVGGAFDAVHEGLAATVEVVEFGFRHRVVDVDRGNKQDAVQFHFVEAMNARRRLFGDAFPLGNDVVETVRGLGMNFLEQVFDDRLFMAVGGAVHPVGFAVFEIITFVDEQGGIAAVVHDELGALAAGEGQCLVGTPPVFFEGFTFPGEDGNARRRDCRRRMILRREDVAARPAHIGTERDERFDENRRLDRHMKRSGDANALQGLARGISLADRHETGHLMLGDIDFFAPEVRKGQIGDFVGQIGFVQGGCV